MDTSAFDIQFMYKDLLQHASIHPCCREENIVDYAVWQNNKLLFTITRQHEDSRQWVLALKNADHEFDDEMVQQIGAAIQDHQSN